MLGYLTEVLRKEDGWFVAHLEELPGVNTQGRTKEEACTNLADALTEYLEANRELSRRQQQSGAEREQFAVITLIGQDFEPNLPNP